MSWLAPGGLAFLGLLVPLILLYVLRPRRRERRVGSTLLWEAVVRERSAERPFQRLVARSSLLLQAAVLALGALALSRPACRVDGAYSGRLAIVVDVSVSMRASEVDGRTRLDQARAAALARIEALDPVGEAMVVEAGRSPRSSVPLTHDRRALRHAIASLRGRSAESDLAAALQLARDRLRGEGRLVVITDLAFDGRLVAETGDLETELVRVGREADNWSVVGADAVIDELAGESASRSTRVKVFARVASHARRARELTVEVEGEDGRPLVARRVGLPAGETVTVTLTFDIPADALDRVLTVRLRRLGGTALDDSLALDDFRSLRAPSLRALPVVVLPDAPESLVRALRADRRTSVFIVEPRDLAAALARPALRDALVVTRGTLPPAVRGHDALVVDFAETEGLGVTRGSSGPSARWLRVATEDETMRFVTPSEWAAESVAPLVGDDSVPLLVTDRGPAIVRVDRDEATLVLLGFDPARSIWPRDPSYVVFLHDVVGASLGRATRRDVPDGCLGEPIRPNGQGSSEGWSVRAPDGEGRAVPSGPTEPLDGPNAIPDRPGVYLVGDGRRERPVLRLLCDVRESDLSPRGEVAFASRSNTAREAGSVVRSDLRDLGPHLALFALTLVLLESVHATRRARR